MASFRGSRLLVLSLVGLSLFLLVAVVVFPATFGARKQWRSVGTLLA